MRPRPAGGSIRPQPMFALSVAVVLGAAAAACVRWRRGRGFLVVAAAAAGVLLAWRFAVVPEDTFISMRYARNLVRGDGLVWNPGERVEGYTNFLWTLVLAGVHAVRLPPLETAIFLCWAAFAAVIALTHRAVVRLGGDGDAAAGSPSLTPIAPLLLALHPEMIDAGGSGLESMPFALCVTAGLVGHAEWLRAGRPAALRWALAAFVAGVLMRPEGVAIGGVALAAGWLVTRRDPRRTAAHVRSLAVLAFVAAGHVAWRRWTYGDWVPNTYHCKVAWTAEQAQRGVAQLADYVRRGSGCLLLPLVVLPFALRTRPWLVPAACASAFVLAYFVAVGGDNFGRCRYLVPVLPAAFLLAEVAARHALRRADLRAAAPAAAFGLIAAAAAATLPWRDVPPFVPVADRFIELREVAARWTADAGARHPVAVLRAGAAPYYAPDVRFIDLFGLNDRHIARTVPVSGAGRRNAGHEKFDLAYVLDRNPLILDLDLGPSAVPQPRSIQEDYARARPDVWARLLRDYEVETVRIAGRTTWWMRRRGVR